MVGSFAGGECAAACASIQDVPRRWVDLSVSRGRDGTESVAPVVEATRVRGRARNTDAGVGSNRRPGYSGSSRRDDSYVGVLGERLRRGATSDEIASYLTQLRGGLDGPGEWQTTRRDRRGSACRVVRPRDGGGWWRIVHSTARASANIPRPAPIRRADLRRRASGSHSDQSGERRAGFAGPPPRSEAQSAGRGPGGRACPPPASAGPRS